MADLKQVIEESFVQYAGAVLQSRALVDVRDGLKPSARQILYCMDMCKYTADKPFQASAAVVGDAMKYFYVHGDASCLGVVMRAAQPFAMRYPLVDVSGNGGTLIESGNWAAARYTKARLSKLGNSMFTDIKKDTIREWRDNFSDTEQYPSVLPTKGFYNLCNGTSGIGIGMASSVPQFNVREMNKALCYLIDHPDCDFEDIYCAPDFATGAVLYNENEVKDSLRKGEGFACKLRSVVEFNQKERCFVVTEIPYGVYTNTICGELEEIINSEENPGIERFNDLTGATPLIKIFLNKTANPDKTLRYLYKNTSLQHYFGINFTMLDQGRYPKVFTWKEALQAHINHEKEVYRRGFEFDLRKIEARIHIIDGLLICLASIDEVVQTIKSSNSTADAALNLKKKFLLDDDQAKAVLDMKLSRLAHLEVKKLENERDELVKEAAAINAILNDEVLFNNELKKNWEAVAAKYGDARRTKIMNLAADGDEPIEVKRLQVSLTNRANIYVAETSTLYTQKRGGVGSKLKLEDGEYVIGSNTVDSTDELLFFSASGNVYHAKANTFPISAKSSLYAVLPIKTDEHFCALTALTKTNTSKYIIFVTKLGYIKKSELTEYNVTRNVGLRAITLNPGDEIISVLFTNDDKIGISTEMGNFIIVTTSDIRAIGRIAQGIHGIKLNDDDHASAAHIIPQDTQYIASISGGGLFKKTAITEFAPQGKNTKGSKLQKLNELDWLADFVPISTKCDILIASTRSSIKVTSDDIPISGKGTIGVKSIKLTPQDSVVKILLN